uniref:Uncharacterized protein n=1 Tax=Octactis speculum TaxID=3111310 RepID=A0A7S2D0G8_9STRA|mmetsp:Transcript_4204/g.4928  ORF Transcript_4204/g.4928 Transcript_4204/m.4928 type:complete len:107 (+) Transcript_4204:163-483(+)
MSMQAQPALWYGVTDHPTKHLVCLILLKDPKTNLRKTTWTSTTAAIVQAMRHQNSCLCWYPAFKDSQKSLKSGASACLDPAEMPLPPLVAHIPPDPKPIISLCWHT